MIKTVDLEKLFLESPAVEYPQAGTILDGEVILVDSSRILVSLSGGLLTGIISGKDTKDRSQTIKTLKVGDEISAFVKQDENEQGFVVLSLSKVSREKTWKAFVAAYENEETISVKACEANKGGLLLDVDGIKGFIPVSQLAPLHYPRVDGGDSNKILSKLEALIGIEFKVKVINIDPINNKLILSEKAAYQDERKSALNLLKVGQKVQGQISSIVKFGLFVTFNGLEGLVHISEIAWGHVNNPNNYGKVGDNVEVLIIGIEDNKISLSIKQLHNDPWLEVAKKYKAGKKVTGIVNRITQFGAFVKLSDDINGLIHLSELSDDDSVTSVDSVLQLGETIEAVVINVDSDEHRIGLSLKSSATKAKEEVKEEVKEEAKEEVKEEVKEEAKEEAKEEGSDLDGLGLSEKILTSLNNAGIKSKADLKGKSVEDLTALEGIGAKTAEKILSA